VLELLDGVHVGHQDADAEAAAQGPERLQLRLHDGPNQLMPVQTRAVHAEGARVRQRRRPARMLVRSQVQQAEGHGQAIGRFQHGPECLSVQGPVRHRIRVREQELGAHQADCCDAPLACRVHRLGAAHTRANVDQLTIASTQLAGHRGR
jgi:hypothetical protein